MISCKFYLHNFTSTKGKSSIYCRVFCDGLYELRTSTHERILREAWHHENQKVLARKERYASEINNRLQHIAGRVQKEFRVKLDNGEVLTDQDLKLIIRPNDKKINKGPVMVQEYFDEWADSYKAKKNRGKPEGKAGHTYVNNLQQVVTKIVEFDQKARPSDLDKAWVNRFEHWLLSKYDIQDSSLSLYWLVLRKLRELDGLSKEHISSGKKVRSDKFDLTWEEVLQLRDAEYSDEKLRRDAHAFVINCQLALRWSDLRALQPHHFLKVHSHRHGDVVVLDKSQQKTSEPVLIPVPPMAAALLEQYGWEIPLVRTKKGNAITHQFGERIRDAAEEAKLTRLVRTRKVFNGQAEEGAVKVHEKITSHIARHTGYTRIRSITKNKELAEALVGHVDNSAYDHPDPVIIVDDLLDAWGKVEEEEDRRREKKEAL
ncbi:hypothetical protein OB13_16065 [Pontibacter sp. HJ8]